MIENGSTPAKINPNLLANSKISFPRNQVVFVIRERRETATGVRAEETLNEHAQVSADAHEEFLKSLAAKGIQSRAHFARSGSVASDSASSAGGVSHSLAEKGNEARTKTAVVAMRKEHSGWDRTKRDPNGLVARTKKIAKIDGTTVERDLVNLIDAVNRLDQIAMGCEAKSLRGEALTDDDMKDAAAMYKEIQNNVTEGREMAAGLKAWFKFAA